MKINIHALIYVTSTLIVMAIDTAVNSILICIKMCNLLLPQNSHALKYFLGQLPLQKIFTEKA